MFRTPDGGKAPRAVEKTKFSVTTKSLQLNRAAFALKNIKNAERKLAEHYAKERQLMREIERKKEEYRRIVRRMVLFGNQIHNNSRPLQNGETRALKQWRNMIVNVRRANRYLNLPPNMKHEITKHLTRR